MEKSNFGRLFATVLFSAVFGIVLFGVNFFTEQTYVRIHLVWMWLSLFYIIFSWRWSEQVQAGFNAVLQRFGKNVATLEPGLHFAPLWIYKLHMVNMQIDQKELPDEPENIWLGDIDKIPTGKKPALRVPFRDSISKAKAVEIFGNKIIAPDGTRFQADVPVDGLARRVTAPVVPVVEYVVKNPELFITRFPNPAALMKVLEDEVFRVINMLMPNMSIGQALANKAWLNSHLKKTVEDRIESDNEQGLDWGADIVGAYIKNLPLHHGLNKAIGEASEAEFTGRADKELAIQRGKGAATAAHDLEAMTLKGRAKGIEDMKATGMTAQEVQSAEVARSIAEGGNTIVVGADGFGQLAAVAGAMIGKNGQKPGQKGNP